VPRLAFSAFDRYVEGDGMNWPQFQGGCHELSPSVPICHLLLARCGLIIASTRAGGNAFVRLKAIGFNVFTFCLRNPQRFALSPVGD
jgi:hypothetical protein